MKTRRKKHELNWKDMKNKKFIKIMNEKAVKTFYYLSFSKLK